MSDTLKSLAFDQFKAARNLNHANILKGATSAPVHAMTAPLARALSTGNGRPNYSRADHEVCQLVNG